MKPYTRQASVTWRGTPHPGRGRITTPSAVLKSASYSCGSELQRSCTNPPELLAAAHAGSFSMTLAHELGEAGYCPDQIQTTATVTMEKMPAGWTMTQIRLDVVAAVAKTPQCEFIDATLRAKASCPISRLLGAANISICARLSAREVPPKIKLRRRSGPPGAGRLAKNKAGRNDSWLA